MHSYQHNIKTFNNATRHLTRVERSLYRDLIELYYDREKPLPADNFDRLARLALANSDEEKEALRYVLSEFFTETNGLYVHDYCDEQIEKFYSNTTAKALAGKASAKARMEKKQQRQRERENENQTDVEQNSTGVERIPTNHKTSNHNKPITNLKDITPQAAPSALPKLKTQLDYSCWPAMPSDQTMGDWIAMRKRLKANVSQTVVNRFSTELHKAVAMGYTVDQCLGECVTRNWRGFEAQWITNQNNQRGVLNATNQPKSAVERFMRDNYPDQGPNSQDDHGSMGRNARPVRGEVVESVRGEDGRYGPVGADHFRLESGPDSFRD